MQRLARCVAIQNPLNLPKANLIQIKHQPNSNQLQEEIKKHNEENLTKEKTAKENRTEENTDSFPKP